MKVPEFEIAATVPALLAWDQRNYAERELAVSPGDRLTYRAAEEESARLAATIVACGVGKGSRVGILLPNTPRWVVAFLAIQRVGGIAVGLSTFYQPPELLHALRLTDVQLLITAAQLGGRDTSEVVEAAVGGLDGQRPDQLMIESAPYLRHVLFIDRAPSTWATSTDSVPGERGARRLLPELESAVTPADAAVIIQTSGSSGYPKAVVHSHGSIVRHGWGQMRHKGVPDGVRTFSNSPYFWVGGLVAGLLTHMHAGGAVLTLERLRPDEMLDFLDRERPTALFGFNLLTRVANHPRVLAGEFDWLPEPNTAQRDAGALRHNAIGMTETGGVHSGPGKGEDGLLPPEHAGSYGPAMPGVERRIIDPVTREPLPDGVEGELCVRGYNLMTGFYKRERHEIFDDDGWYRTGDAGYLKDGLFFFKGRLGDMIKTKGANVAPGEVEQVLTAHDDVRAAVVVGLPDREAGELVAAIVIPEPGRAPSAEQLTEYARSQLSSYKVPRRIVMMDTLPQTSTGKIDRQRLVRVLSENS